MVYVLLGTGFEETEAIAPIDLLRRAGVKVLTVGIGSKTVYGGHGIGVEADITLEEMDLTDLEMIVLPGGLGGVATARASQKALDALRFAWENDKFVAAICAAPLIFGRRGLLHSKNATCFPGFENELAGAVIVNAPVVTDGNITTANGMESALLFGKELVALLTK